MRPKIPKSVLRGEEEQPKNKYNNVDEDNARKLWSEIVKDRHYNQIKSSEIPEIPELPTELDSVLDSTDSIRLYIILLQNAISNLRMLVSLLLSITIINIISSSFILVYLITNK